MAVKFPVGTEVRQVLPAPIAGTVVRFIFDEVAGDIHYVIADANGHESVFKEENIEAV